MSKKILIAPLDWGLGHATRCVPIIRKHIADGNDVMLASNGKSAVFLKKSFPDLTVLDDIPDYRVTYQKSGSFLWNIIRQTPRIISTVKQEHLWLNQKISELQLDEVISDNRYGLYSDKITSTLITHQIFPIVPFPLSLFVHARIKKYIGKFSRCWVPDFENENECLSGKLSHGKIPGNVKYIGPLSRFRKPEKSEPNEFIYEYLALISGPEPQRTIFQQRMVSVLKELGKPALVLCGQPEFSLSFQEENVAIVPHLNDEKMKDTMLQSRYIICRSGYSTIMDLEVLGRKAMLIPTPGQTEQEYLAKHLSKNFGYQTISQSELNSKKIKEMLGIGV